VHTVRDVFFALAALGGHLGRRGDGPPGWQTLWHGLCSLPLLVEAFGLLPNSRPNERQKNANLPAGALKKLG
jgi:hypothetical protein